MNYSQTEEGAALVGDILSLIPAPESVALGANVKALVSVLVDRAYLAGERAVIEARLRALEDELAGLIGVPCELILPEVSK